MKRLHQTGMTLVELLVGFLIGLTLIAGLLQIVVNSGRSFQIQEEMMRMQDNGKYALERLLLDLRNTSYFGCIPSVESISNQLKTGSQFLTFEAGLEGTANENGNGPAVVGSDTITIRGASSVSGGRPLLSPLPTTVSDPLVVGPNSGIEVNDILLISDCNSGDIFQVTGIDLNGELQHLATGSNPGNAAENLSKVYNDKAFVYQTYTRLYDIRPGTNGTSSLYVTDEEGTEELVQGIENMVILYGEDTDKDGVANRYVRANAVHSMQDIVSIRVNLLMSSEQDGLTQKPTAYVFNGLTIMPTDNRLRQEYSSTVMLRNRGR